MDNQNSSRYKITVLLYQQTPMIHFRSNEPGAVLRGSDVKPKLDRFILMQLGGWAKAYSDHPDWFISEKRPALNYKLKIVAPQNGCKVIGSGAAIPPSFFGNMGASSDGQKQTIFYTEPIAMTITCFIPDLMEYIIKGCWGDSLNSQNGSDCPNLRRFFYTTGFGIRSNKGFGSFSTEETHDHDTVLREISQVLMKYNIPKMYYIDYTDKKEPDYLSADRNHDPRNSRCSCETCKRCKNNGRLNPADISSENIDMKRKYLSSWQQMLHISQLYQLLKTGYNNRAYGHYARAFIYYKYREHNRDTGNEKAWMKKSTFTTIGENTVKRTTSIAPALNEYSSGYEEYKYVRALLGIGDKIEFIPIRRNANGDPAYISSCRKVKIGISVHSDNDDLKKIGRAASPIVFRVIGRVTYILPYEQNPAMFDLPFEFTRYGKLSGFRDEDIHLKTSGNIRSLGQSELSVAELIESFAQYINSRGSRYVKDSPGSIGENSSKLDNMRFSNIFRVFSKTIICSEKCSNEPGGAVQ